MTNSVDPDLTDLTAPSLFWVQADCFYAKFVSNVRQLFAANDFSRRHFSDAFFLGVLGLTCVKKLFVAEIVTVWSSTKSGKRALVFLNVF